MKPLVTILEGVRTKINKINYQGRVYYSVSETARLLGVSNDEVDRMISEGSIKDVHRFTPRGRRYVSETDITSHYRT